MIDSYDLANLADAFRHEMDSLNEKHCLRIGYFPREQLFRLVVVAPMTELDLEEAVAVHAALGELIALAEGKK